MRFRLRISLKIRSLLFLFILSIPLVAFGIQSHSSKIAMVEESEIVAATEPEAKSLSTLSTKDWSTIKLINLDSNPTSVVYDRDIGAFDLISVSKGGTSELAEPDGRQATYNPENSTIQVLVLLTLNGFIVRNLRLNRCCLS